jgi:hypothetical protein
VPLLVEVYCRFCGMRFFVCRRCWRGQAYCSKECRRQGRLAVHREAQRRYRQTRKGKKAHRLSENRHRHGLTHLIEKNMADLSSRTSTWRGIESGVGQRCHFCGCEGVVVDRFPRRE